MLRSHGGYAPAVVSTLVASVLVTIILMVASPSSVAATSDEDCWECMSGVGPHEWFEDEWHTDSENDGLYEVSPPDGQHVSDGEDLCLDSHRFMCAEHEEEEVETIVQALDRGDLDAARNAYLRVGDVVTLNGLGVTLIGSLLVCLCLVSTGLAQEEMVVRGEPTCSACVIEFTDVAVVRSPIDIGLTPMLMMALTSGGKAWVTPFTVPHIILRLAPDGTEEMRIGARGQGPQEFNRILWVETGPGDVLYVFGDGKLNRYAPDGKFLGTHRFPRQPLAVDTFEDGSMILNATVYTRDRAGYIFHWIGPDGEIRRSFGPETRGYEFAPIETRRRVTTAGTTTFWAAPRNRYELTLWDTIDGRRRRVLVRDVNWFEPWAGDYEPPFEAPSFPQVMDIAVDEADRLWVLLKLPAQDFAPLSRPEGGLLDPVPTDNPAFDMVIEVLDVDEGKPIARRRLPNTVMKGLFYRGLRVAFPEVSESGQDQVYRIAELSLREGSVGSTVEEETAAGVNFAGHLRNP